MTGKTTSESGSAQYSPRIVSLLSTRSVSSGSAGCSGAFVQAMAASERLAIADPQTAGAEDLDRLRAARTLPDELVVAGYVYDVTDGHVREIIAPAALRKGDGS